MISSRGRPWRTTGFRAGFRRISKSGKGIRHRFDILFQALLCQRPLGLRVGEGVTIWRTSLAAETNGLIEIGDYCYLTNASIVCSSRITIGSYVMISGGVTIADSDFHPIGPAARLADTVALSPVGDRASASRSRHARS